MDDQQNSGMTNDEQGGNASGSSDRVMSEMAADELAQHGSNASAEEMQNPASLHIGGRDMEMGGDLDTGSMGSSGNTGGMSDMGASMSGGMGSSGLVDGGLGGSAQAVYTRVPAEALASLADQLGVMSHNISAGELAQALANSGLTLAPDHWSGWTGRSSGQGQQGSPLFSGSANALQQPERSTASTNSGLPNVAEAALADRLERIASSEQSGFVTLDPLRNVSAQAYTTGTSGAVAALTDEREVDDSETAGSRSVPTEAGMAIQPSGDISSDITNASDAGSAATSDDQPMQEITSTDATEPTADEMSGDAVSMAEAGVGSALAADEAERVEGAAEASSPADDVASSPTLNEQEVAGDEDMTAAEDMTIAGSTAPVSPTDETSSTIGSMTATSDDGGSPTGTTGTVTSGSGIAQTGDFPASDATEQPTIAMPPSTSAQTGSATASSGGTGVGRIIMRSGVEFTLDKDEMIVGREDPVSDIFPDLDMTNHGGEEGGVSRRHARIIRDGDNYLLEDLNSTNYTKLNGVKLIPKVPQAMRDSDTISFGRVEARFALDR